MTTSPKYSSSDHAAILTHFKTEHCGRVANVLAAATAQQYVQNRKICRDNEFPNNYIPVAVTRYYNGAQYLPKDSTELEELLKCLKAALEHPLTLHFVPFDSYVPSVEWDEATPNTAIFSLWVYLLP